MLRRALDLRAALKLGIRVSLDEIRADEFRALVVLEEEQTSAEQARISRVPG